MVPSLPESAFATGRVKDVVCVMINVPSFGWRFVPFIRQDGEEGHVGVARARGGFRTYADVPRLVGWLESRFGYRGRLTLVRDDDDLAVSLRGPR